MIPAIRAAITMLRNGNEALNIPTIDPYFVAHEKANHIGDSPKNGKSSFNLRSEVWNVSLSGLTHDLNIKRLATKFDKTSVQLKIEATVPELKLDGKYKLNGQMLILPMNGKGRLNVAEKDVTAVLTFKSDIFKKDDIEYLNCTSLVVKFKPKATSYYLENVFNGDPKLSETINLFLNENWQEVNDILLPQYFTIISERFRKVANEVFNNIPLDMIFLK